MSQFSFDELVLKGEKTMASFTDAELEQSIQDIQREILESVLEAEGLDYSAFDPRDADQLAHIGFLIARRTSIEIILLREQLKTDE